MSAIDILRNSLAFVLDPLNTFRRETAPLDQIHADAVKDFQDTITALTTGPNAFKGAAADAITNLANDYLHSESKLNGEVWASGASTVGNTAGTGTLAMAALVCEQTEQKMDEALMQAAPPLEAESTDVALAVASDTAAAIEGGFNPVADGAGIGFTTKLGITVGAVVVTLLIALFGAYEWWRGQMESIAGQPLSALPPDPTPRRLVIVPPLKIYLSPEQEQDVDDIMRALQRAGITGISRDYIEALIGRGFDVNSILAAILGWKNAGKSINEINLSLFLAACNLTNILPHGFNSKEQFQQFISTLSNGLNQAGYPCVGAGLGGSAVTGRKFTTQAPFDQGRTSDYDIVIADPQLLQKAKDMGIATRGGGTRTGPLTPDEMRRLGLYALSKRLSRMAGRKVSFMIYNSVVTAAERAPTAVFLKNICR